MLKVQKQKFDGDAAPLRVLLIGGGRMGLSHLAIIGGLLGTANIRVYAVDTSFVNRMMLRLVCAKVRVFKSLTKLKGFKPKSFDVALITTPPSVRSQVIGKASVLSEKVFIEKPLMVQLEENQMSGYVLQHAPNNKFIKGYLADKSLNKVSGRLETNMDFELLGSTWRKGVFGCVAFEFGGHLLTLIGATLPLPVFNELVFSELDVCIHFSQRNHAKFTFQSCGVNFEIELIAGSKQVRKAMYDIEYVCEEGNYTYDLYNFSERSKNIPTSETCGNSLRNIAEQGTSCKYYLRGFEFTEQMVALLSGEFDILNRKQLSVIESMVKYVA